MTDDIFYDNPDVGRSKLPDSVVNKLVGSRLKERRVLMGLNQAELGKRLQISGQQIHKYEAGTDQLSVSKIHELVSILQVPVSYFFDDLAADYLAETESHDYQAIDPLEAQLQKYLDIYKDFSDPKLQKMLLEVTKLFANQLKLLDIAAPKTKKNSSDKI